LEQLPDASAQRARRQLKYLKLIKGGAKVKRLKALFFLLPLLIMQTLPIRAWASEGLDVPEPLNRKVALEGLSGISLFFAKTYNDNLLLYALLCTLLMAAVGMAIALVTDVALKSLGMEVGKIEHKE
jgi:ABC-type phosphate/phosphonate transport system permease subunit